MSTIPASAIVNVTPGVLSAGGSALDMIGLVLSTNVRVPIGSTQAFSSPAAVEEYFGSTSDEASIANIYFAGFDNSLVKPGSILFAQYPLNAVGAYLRGADTSSLTLAELQALSGTLGLTIDGSPVTASISLAAATSFSNAAQIIGFGLGIKGPSIGTCTGSISGTTLPVSAISGTLAVGDIVQGTGVTVGTYVVAQLSGTTGGVGTYTVSPTQNALSQSITIFAPGVTYDSVSGGFIAVSGTVGTGSTISYGSGALATSLKLTLATGATISQGAGAAVPATFMDDLIAVTQNWATFMLAFDPDVSGNTNKLAFAAWTNTTNKRFAFVCWDTDESPTAAVPATASLGYLIAQADYSGTCLIFSPDFTLAAFVCGIAASIAFAQPNGRTTFKFRSQSGLVASVTDQTVADNLASNGYNYYGAFSTANDQFVFFANGVISGPFEWMDSYINQIWLNNAFQLALVTLLTNAFSIPYNAAGRAQIQSAMADSINAGLSFGAFRPGVVLSSSQVSSVNSSAGQNIAPTLQTNGWYLQVLDASPTVRQARGSPPCTFWYVDGQSVQKIDLSSIEVE